MAAVRHDDGIAVRRLTRFLAAIALGLALSIAQPARAQEGDPESAPSDPERPVASEAQRLIDDAQRLYAELEFLAAIDSAQRALATPGVRDADRASALETLGSALVVLDREAAANEAFEALFQLDPYWVVREPSGSPRIRRFVDAVRARVVSDAALDPELELRLDLPRAARAGRNTTLEVRAEGGSPHSIVLRVRGEGELDWSRVEARRVESGRFTIELPARDETGELELYAEARDSEGHMVARAGGPLAPYRLPVRPAGEGGSITDEWWLWAAIGGAVIVIGASIAIGVAATGPQRAADGTLPPNRVELPLVRF